MVKRLLVTASFFMEDFVMMSFNHETHKLGLFFDPKCGASKFWLTSNGLHGITSQKTELLV
jgi:hypothetical protein